MLRRAFIVGLGLGLASLGCAPPEPEARPTEATPTPAEQREAIYVGAVDATELKVGLVLENGQAALFFCGGETSLAQTKWFRGAAPDAKKVTFEKDGWKATGDVSVNEVTGTVVLGSGAAVAWKATRVAEGSVAGLYESRGTDGTAGVVVSSEDAAQGAFIKPTAPATAAPVAQIIVIRPIRPLAEGLKVKVEDREIFVTRVQPK